MTTNKETKFNLVTKDTRELVLMERTGEPFVYSSKELAQRGKRSIENLRKVALTIVPA
jgi:hypothetical protein